MTVVVEFRHGGVITRVGDLVVVRHVGNGRRLLLKKGIVLCRAETRNDVADNESLMPESFTGFRRVVT
jgi:hypothetical protein